MSERLTEHMSIRLTQAQAEFVRAHGTNWVRERIERADRAERKREAAERKRRFDQMVQAFKKVGNGSDS